ncbi:SRPBCC family protein [Undibacterium curvum]|uniref:SRPBCC family protein n=1 Tax=Undibacterium curvum TaxID=2762294 RepID=UPI003D1425B5
MKFEHLIEINDLLNPLAYFITREQLWRGLILRAEAPKMFVPYLDEALIAERTEISMQRTLKYGALEVRDSVTFEHQQHVHYAVPAQGEITPSTLRMQIEEPQAQRLFLRFTYDDGLPEAEDQESRMYNNYRKSAYQDADIDTVKVIRELAEAGRLDALPS